MSFVEGEVGSREVFKKKKAACLYADGSDPEQTEKFV